MTDEMDGKARKISVTSSDGRNSMCIAAVCKKDVAEGEALLRVFDSIHKGSRECLLMTGDRLDGYGRSILARCLGSQIKRSPALGLIRKATS